MIDRAVRLPHRLSVVWFSDLVGWSSLTAEDEDKAIALMRRFQAAVRAAVPPEMGRIVKFIGDAALVESPSAEAAVRAAAELRGLMRAGESIRTGVHLGDVAVGLGDGDVRKQFEEGVDSLAASIGRWDTGSWSRYDLAPRRVVNVSSSFYHALHIDQLRAMVADIQASLDREERTDTSFAARMREAARQFEDSHPTLTNTVGRVADMLAQMGI